MVHTKRFHSGDNDMVQSPLGMFPISNSVRILFDEDDSETEKNNDDSFEETVITKEAEIENWIMSEYLKVWFVEDPFFPENKDNEPVILNDGGNDGQKCEECNKRDEIIESQRKMLLSQDKKIDALNKGGRSTVKHLRSEFKKATKKTDDALSAVGKTTIENTNLKIELQVQKDLVVALKLKLEERERSHNKEANTVSQEIILIEGNKEEGPLSNKDSKCDKCPFVSKNRVLLEEHIRNKHHKELKCLMCGSISPNLAHFKKHKKKHQDELDIGRISHYPNNVYNIICTPCDISFKTQDDLMDHMCMVH